MKSSETEKILPERIFPYTIAMDKKELDTEETHIIRLSQAYADYLLGIGKFSFRISDVSFENEGIMGDCELVRNRETEDILLLNLSRRNPERKKRICFIWKRTGERKEDFFRRVERTILSITKSSSEEELFLKIESMGTCRKKDVSP